MRQGWAVSACVLTLLPLLLLASSGPLLAAGYPGSATAGPVNVSASGGWTNVTSPPIPPTLAGAMMAYSPFANRFVLFGGWNGDGVNQTWTYDPTNRTWGQIVAAVAPSTRGDAQFSYDSHDNVFVLYGGWHEDSGGSYVRTADTWAFSLTNDTWWDRHPAIAPSPRSDAAIAYDSADNQILLFGGFSGTTYLGDSWSYAYANNTWSPRSSPVMPSARADGRMVYDPVDGLFFLYGGNDYSDPSLNFHHLADTWEYAWDSNQWTEVPTHSSPGARDYAVLAYDPPAHALLLFGGYGNHTILGDTWAYEFGSRSWQPIASSVAPPPRFAAVGGYDPQDDQFVVFGGLGNTGLLADTWVLPHFAGPAPADRSPQIDILILVGLIGFGVTVAAMGFQIHHRFARREKPFGRSEPDVREPGRPR